MTKSQLLPTSNSFLGIKAVVVGASGFIGSHVVDALLARGCQVRAVARHFPGLIAESAMANSSLTIYQHDMRDRLALEQTLEGVDLVIHLASGSLPQSSNRFPHDDVKVNLLGALNLLEAARQNNVKKMVVISSGGTVYGVPNQSPISEEHPTDPICSYGITKLAIEKYVSLYRKIYGLNSIVLRLANPYGERQRLDSTQGVVPVFLGRALRHQKLEIWGDGTIVRDFLYISDAIDAILSACMYYGSEHLFNVGSGVGLSLNDLIYLIEQEVGYSLEVSYQLARGFDVPANVLCIDKVQTEFKWHPKVSASEGLHRFHRWLVKNQRVNPGT